MVLNAADDSFAETLSDAIVQRTEARYLEEPRGRWAGNAMWLAKPRSAKEVSDLVKHCAAARVGIIPYGGGTGLVGGQISEEGPAPLIISLERMTAIRAVYPDENVLVADAGAVLADIQTAADNAGRLFPLSLAAQGTARIGGNLATNAGGVNVLRYGNARDLCLGLEAVLADGQIWHGLKRLRKDNTGYDLRNLLIGSEGTLGIITGASLRLAPKPAGVGTAMFAVESPAAALRLLSMARDQVGEGVSTFELIHRQGLDFLTEVLPDIRQPFSDVPEWSVLVEFGLPKGLTPQDALSDLFALAHEAGLVSDGVIAQSESQRASLWAVREQIPEANRRIGSVSSHDISVPLGVISEFIIEGHRAIAKIGAFRINCFGHLGDGNLHYNVFPMAGRSRADHENQRGDIKQVVHDLVDQLGGSVSAEHGIGRLKVNDLAHYGDPAKLSAMRAIKAALDPLGIMNPGAVVPPA